MADVLIIEDSITTLIVLRRVLTADGHDVRTLDSFVELPRILRNEPPDLILLDLEMPALSGVGFGHFIRRYQIRETPILIHSSHSRAELEQAARLVGAVGILPEGATPEDVREAARTALAQKIGPPRQLATAAGARG